MNKAICLFLLIVSIAASGFLFGQSHQLKGTLINNSTGQPIPNARLEIDHGDMAYSDDYGSYVLDLDVGSNYGPGEELIIHINHKKYGYYMDRFVVPKSLSHTFRITPNTMKSFTGVITDVESGEPLKGMRVSFFSQQFADPSYSPPVIFSDESGFFRFIIDKKQVGEIDYAQLSVVDDNRCYESFNSLVNINGTQKIVLKDKCKPAKAPGGDYKRESIPGCEKLGIGTICFTNISQARLKIYLARSSSIRPDYTESASRKSFWLEPDEERCVEGLQEGIYVIEINDPTNIQHPNGFKVFGGLISTLRKTLVKCETIKVDCKL